jgi:hypothetical protein
MKTFDDSTLLPCPLCGSPARCLHGYETGRVSCSNENCCAYGLQTWPQHWNTRATEADNAELAARGAVQEIEQWIADHRWCIVHEDEECDCSDGFVFVDDLRALLSGKVLCDAEPAAWISPNRACFDICTIDSYTLRSDGGDER